MNNGGVSKVKRNMIQLIQIGINSVKAYISIPISSLFVPMESGGEY